MTQVLKIYGPPGTGKTTALLQLLEKELQQSRPDRVAFVTFTRSAREEVLARTKSSAEDLPFCRTIHSICYRLLRVHRGQVVTPRSLQAWGREIGVDLSGKTPDPMAEDAYGDTAQVTIGDRLLGLNHLGRHRMVGLKSMLDSSDDPELEWELAKWFTEAYRAWKTREGLLDYTDLLTEYLRRGEPLVADTLFVDEAQDLSKLQWAVVDRLAASVDRVYLAGDDDQAIFTWAGASAHEFNRRPAHETRVLDRSWRCPRQVMDLARTITDQIEERTAKDVKPRDSEGEVTDAVQITDDLLDRGRSFVLYRHHHRGRALAKTLDDLAIPYLGSGSPLGDHRIHLALQAWNRWERGERANLAQTQAVLNLADPGFLKVRETEGPLTGHEAIHDFKHQEVFQVLRAPRRDWLWRCLEARGWTDLLQPRVTLQSIHQSKGQEADTVILDLELSRKAWEGMLRQADDEHRVWYVGVTRARERLIRLMPTGSLSYQL
jgi:superfamily I DNA/RNA helicase